MWSRPTSDSRISSTSCEGRNHESFRSHRGAEPGPQNRGSSSHRGGEEFRCGRGLPRIPGYRRQAARGGIMNLSDRIVVLNLGRKIAEAPPTEVVKNSDVVEAYLGFPDIVDKLRGAES